MKQLQKSDLKEGEIYKQLDFNYIFLYNKNETFNSFNDGTAISTTAPRYCKRWTANGFEKDMIEATPEEKHWLETCIKADKFVSYEEAMKSFIPEYVECLIEYKGFCAEDAIVGKIYKTSVECSFTINGWNHIFKNHSEKFKPSTKEAYDAQFVVKEPEFVLPELWCIKLTNENQKTVIDYINRNTKDGERGGLISAYYGYNGEHCTFIPNTLSNTEITFDQFKQYVLKENTTVTEEPKVVLEEPKDKVIQTTSSGGIRKIDKVECSEGGVYKIGDKITVFTKDSPNKGKVFTIKGFRWNNAKTNICAITELHTPNGIGLDKIELYVEPKVKQELSLLEQAKLKYPIGTKFKVACQPHVICTVLNHDTYHFQTSEICNLYVEEQNYGVKGATVYYKGKWAEIVDDFVLPEKWCVEVNFEIRNRFGYYEAYGYHHSIQINDTNKWSINIKEGFTEITFEQFKKYVLKDE